MAKLFVSRTARSDIFEIIGKLQRSAGKDVARRYIDDFDAAFDRLRDFPGIGTPHRRLRSGIRFWVISPYIIFHLGGPKAKEVHVLRVLHGRWRITRRMIAAGRDTT